MLNIQPKAKQVTALNMLRRDWKQYRTFLLYAPTGYGKTAVAAFITDGFVSHGLRVMLVVPYTTLITQTAKRFIAYGLPEDQIGYVWRDHPPYDPDRQIQIASAQTLIRREFPDNIDLLVVDEAHMRHKGILEIIRDSGVKVVGLSGTPFSPFLGNYYQRLIKPTTIKELIAAGDLSRYEFYAPTKPDLIGVRTTNTADFGNDYQESQVAEIMCGATLVGDIVENWLQNGNDLPTVCFCVNVAHANYITIAFNQAGINAEVMVAGTPQDERQMIIHRFEQGATKIIVNVGVLVAGFDSDVRCIIYARPTKSEIRWLQCIGRGLRTAHGKDACRIFDHSGSVHRLGFPDDIEYDHLPAKNDGMKENAVRDAEKREEKLPKECPSCHFMKPAGIYVCPKCGFKPLNGEDVEVDNTRRLKKMGKKDRMPTQAEKQAWWSQIKYYQIERATQGKTVTDGWCSHTYHDKFGSWPNGLHDTPMQITPVVSGFIKSKRIAFAKARQKAVEPGAKQPKADFALIPPAGPAPTPQPVSNGRAHLARSAELLRHLQQGRNA